MVGELTPGGLDHDIMRQRVRGTDNLGHIPLELHRIDHHHILRTRMPRTRHGGTVHTTGAIDHHGVARTHATRGAAVPQPVGTPQLMSAATSKGMPSGILMQENSELLREGA
jgi:hypothetical protein